MLKLWTAYRSATLSYSDNGVTALITGAGRNTRDAEEEHFRRKVLLPLIRDGPLQERHTAWGALQEIERPGFCERSRSGTTSGNSGSGGDTGVLEACVSGGSGGKNNCCTIEGGGIATSWELGKTPHATRIRWT